MNRLICLVFANLLLLSCRSNLVLAPPGADHPASPDAREAPLSAEPSILALGLEPRPLPEGDSTEDEHAHDSKESAALYTCPMHPGVRQEGPGNCPTCGMKLSKEAPEAHHHGDKQ